MTKYQDSIELRWWGFNFEYKLEPGQVEVEMQDLLIAFAQHVESYSDLEVVVKDGKNVVRIKEQ